MRSLHCLLIALLSLATVSAEARNVVLIMADDVGLECFGCYGSEQYQTPRIDALAAAGTRFTNCFSQPLCTPSRVKLMTGVSNVRNYVGFAYMDPGLKTIGHTMRQAGYRTLVAGKWQLQGFNAAPGVRERGTGLVPWRAGFDHHCLWQITSRPLRYWSPELETSKGDWTGGPDEYGPDRCVDAICDFLGEPSDKPFFVYYPMILVHDPFLPTPDSADRDSKDEQHNFEDMVAYMDKCVGRIVDRLEELKLRDDTLILFTGDNGTHRKIRSRLGDRVLQGGKGSTADAGTRVPLVASLPGFVPEGRTNKDLIDFADFLPTIAEFAGADLLDGQGVDGVSFAPQLHGRPGTPREWVHCYYWSRPHRLDTAPRQYVRDARWKLYRTGEFYDTHNDPQEKRPIAPPSLEAAGRRAYDKLLIALESLPSESRVIYRPAG